MLCNKKKKQLSNIQKTHLSMTCLTTCRFFSYAPYKARSSHHHPLVPSSWPLAIHTSTSTTASRSFPGSTVKTWSLGGRVKQTDGSHGFFVKKTSLKFLLDICTMKLFDGFFWQTFALLQGDLVTFDCQFEVKFGGGIAVFHIFCLLFSVRNILHTRVSLRKSSVIINFWVFGLCPWFLRPCTPHFSPFPTTLDTTWCTPGW